MGFRHVSAPFVVQDKRCVAWPADKCVNDGLVGCKSSGADHMIGGYLSNLRECILASSALPPCTQAMLPLWETVKGLP